MTNHVAPTTDAGPSTANARPITASGVANATDEKPPARPKRWSTRRRALAAALGLALAGTLCAAGTVGWLTFLRAPENAPAAACRHEPAPGGRPVVVAAGASMTRGTLGADWVGALRARPEALGHELVNAGVNGNTAADLLERVDSDIVPAGRPPSPC